MTELEENDQLISKWRIGTAEASTTANRKRRSHQRQSTISSFATTLEMPVLTVLPKAVPFEKRKGALAKRGGSIPAYRKRQRLELWITVLLISWQGRSCLGQPVSFPTTSPIRGFPIVGGASPTAMPSAPPSAMPSISPRPTASSQPSISILPSYPPTKSPTFKPTVSPRPSQSPTMAPSPDPTVSLQPSDIPSASPMPSQSPQPSIMPSEQPSRMPTAEPTKSPTLNPTFSAPPSAGPSVSPSVVPTTSSQPSNVPSVSMQPTISLIPSVLPSLGPSGSYKPSHSPSQIPSQVPSTSPSTPFPTMFPTPSLQLVQQDFLSMILWGIDRDVGTFERTSWVDITSRHVQLYWRTFNRDVALFHVGRVTTTLFREERVELSSFVRRKLQGNSSKPMPLPLRIVYSQEIEYDLRVNITSDQLPSFLSEQDLFTLPFQQDALSYTRALETELRNNSNPIFLDFIGIVDSPAEESKSRETTILVSIVAVVVTSIFIAGGVIAYLTHFREPANADILAPDSPVGAFIGVNTTENILLSESYDEDYKSPLSSNVDPNSRKPSPNDRSTPSGSDPPMRIVRGDSNSPNVATTISDIGSTGDATDRYKSSGLSGGSIHSVNQLTGGGNIPYDDLSPTREPIEEYHEDSATNDGDSQDDHSDSAPSTFMRADFQMKIKDLE